MSKILKLSSMAIWGIALAAILTLSGCATGASSLECGIESLNPTVMSAIDSFESAALAIRLSNRVLLEVPISEQDAWPEKLFGAPSGGALIKMGLSLLGASQGITPPLEIDRQTGLPRPTSSLYLFLKDREQMLSREASRDDIRFFRSQPPNVIARTIPVQRRRPGEELIDDHVYRNPLMAYGVVTANRMEMLKVEQDIELTSQGFKQCDAWVRNSREGDVRPAACYDPALKQANLEVRMKKAVYTERTDERTGKPGPPGLAKKGHEPPGQSRSGGQLGRTSDLNSYFEPEAPHPPAPKKLPPGKTKRGKSGKPSEEEAIAVAPVPEPEPMAVTAPSLISGLVYANEQEHLVTQKTEELETMRKNYGRLAGRVHKASVAGADFTMSSVVKLGCAINNASKALPKIKEEFKGAKGYYNLAMVVSRVKIIINALGYYKNSLGLQFTAYRTMYQQLSGTYPELNDPGEDPAERHRTIEALNRIELAIAVMQELEPKLARLASGEELSLSDEENARLEAVSKLYPSQNDLAKTFLATLDRFERR